jgi:hypothetical protein
MGAYAQIRPGVNLQKVKKSSVKVVPAIKPGAPAAESPVNKGSTSTQPSPVYALTAVRVRVKTGSDNKEFPSQVHVLLMANSTLNNWRNYMQLSLGNEMRINSETEFGLNVEGAQHPSKLLIHNDSNK